MKKRLLISSVIMLFATLVSCTLFCPRHTVALPILMYHDICPDDTQPGLYSVTESKFRSDMEYLASNGYVALTAEDLITCHVSSRLPSKKAVMITFDDGYLSNITLGEPILSEMGLKATVSVVGIWVENGNTYMTVQDAKEAQSRGIIDIQCHTYNLHLGDKSLLDANPPYGCGIARREGETKREYRARLREDLTKAKALLSEIGSDMALVAFPYGIYDRWAGKVLDEFGVEVTLKTKNSICEYTGANRGLVRLSIFNNTDLADILP